MSLIFRIWRLRLPLIGLATVLLLAQPCFSQELEPRRWSHLPTGLNFAGGGYAYTKADISDSPALRLDDVEMEMSSWLFKYIRTFELFDKSARVDLTQGYQKGRWTGLLDGKPASTERAGWTDSVARLSVNLYGAPPLTGKDYADYRAVTEVETIVGAALAVHFPTGEYMSDRLINLGSNRYTIRPQFGVVHTRYNWTLEAGAAAWIYTDNDDFFGGSRLENDPLYVFQGHAIYNWESGIWAGASAAYAFGKRSTVDDVEKNDRKEIIAWSLSAGYPITRDWGAKVGYVGRRRRSTTGNDTDSFVIAISHFW
jgi:hypothetical protein